MQTHLRSNFLGFQHYAIAAGIRHRPTPVSLTLYRFLMSAAVMVMLLLILRKSWKLEVTPQLFAVCGVGVDRVCVIFKPLEASAYKTAIRRASLDAGSHAAQRVQLPKAGLYWTSRKSGVYTFQQLPGHSVSNFYIIAHEAGAENFEIPAWANLEANPAALDRQPTAAVSRIDIANVPGAFQLLNLLSRTECERLVDLSEKTGYLEDAAVSLPRAIRHNDSFTWIVDDDTNDIIWQRCRQQLKDTHENNAGKHARGINSRFRFYRYGPGDYFAPHTDGSWPGSRVIDGELIDNAYDDRWSQLTLLLFLSEDYEGGATRFYLSPDNPARPASNPNDAIVIDVRTPIGGALCFPHGVHPLHCMHASQKISAGIKYIIRTDVLFDL